MRVWGLGRGATRAWGLGLGAWGKQVPFPRALSQKVGVPKP
jgi:hypothetical protein